MHAVSLRLFGVSSSICYTTFIKVFLREAIEIPSTQNFNELIVENSVIPQNPPTNVDDCRKTINKIKNKPDYGKHQLFRGSDDPELRRPKNGGIQPYKFEDPGETGSIGIYPPIFTKAGCIAGS